MKRISSQGAALLAAGILAVPAPSVIAAETAADLERVVLTATRTEQDIDDALASVTLITAADIERLQPRDLRDLLAARAGISIANSGGAGKLTSIFMRGTNSDHVLVLVNGQRFGSPTAGIAAIQDIPVEQVERIEIVRGPRASLYGSDAIGGVINIITRNPETGLEASVDLGVGSYGRNEIAAGIGSRDSDSWYRIDVSQDTLDGFDSCVNTGTSGCFANEPDDDGYENTSVSARAGLAFGGDGRLEFDAWQASGETEFDGFYNRSEFTRSAYNLRAGKDLGELLRFTARAGHSTDDSDNFGAFASGSLETVREEFSLQSDIALDELLLTIGGDFRHDDVDSSTPYAVTERDTQAGFLQAQYEWNAWRAEGAMRFTDDDQFGSRSTGSIAFGRSLGKNLDIYASHGSAFHAPTFNDLYFPGFGNPDLRPEVSHSTEIGLRQVDGGQRYEANLFRNGLSNLIVFDGGLGIPVNVEDAEIRGLELKWSMSNRDWLISTELTLLDAKNESGANEGNELPRRADRSLRIEIDREFDGWSLGTGLQAEGRRYDNVSNTTELAGYGLVDLRARWQIDANWELAARVGNLLDRDYQTVAGYHQAGRNAQIDLRYRY